MRSCVGPTFKGRKKLNCTIEREWIIVPVIPFADGKIVKRAPRECAVTVLLTFHARQSVNFCVEIFSQIIL